MTSLINITTATTLVLLLSACAYQPYDPKSPNEYADFWCQPDNIKQSLAYQLKFDRTNTSRTPQPPTVNPCDMRKLKEEH